MFTFVVGGVVLHVAGVAQVLHVAMLGPYVPRGEGEAPKTAFGDFLQHD